MPSEPSKLSEPESCYSPRNCSVDMDIGITKVSGGGTSISGVCVDDSTEKNDATSMEGKNVELRYACDPAPLLDDCSTSGSHQPDCAKILQKNRGNVIGERNKRKRWRGRYDEPGVGASLSGSRKELIPTALMRETNMLNEAQVFG